MTAVVLAVAAGALVAGLASFLRPVRFGAPPPLVVVAACAAGALVVGLGDAAPTGWVPFDLLLRIGFGAVVPLAARRAGPATTGWLVLVATALALLVEPPGALATGAVAGAFLALGVAGAANPFTAIAAVAALGPLAHADWPVATGASALAAAVATIPVLLVGLARAAPRPRRRIGSAVGLAVLVLAFGAAAGLVAALGARGEVDDAVDLAREGIDLLGDDGPAARDRLRQSAERFDAAHDELRSWWGRAALLVPGVAQQSRAVSTMASAGADLARTAATASQDADVDSIRPRGGRVDLEAVVDLQEPLDRSIGALRRAARELDGVRSPLLLAPVTDRLTELRTEVDDAEDAAEVAFEAVSVAPDLLGGDGLRRYFLAFQTPSEQRGDGGFMGSWAELTAEDGLLTLTRSGRVRQLIEEGEPFEERTLEGLDELEAVYGDDARQWGVHNFSPDNPTVSRAVAQLYPQSGGAHLDGVISLTPQAFAGFLELTGPVEVDGYPQPLTPENAERVLLHEQYLEFPQAANSDREDFLADAVEVLFDELTSGELAGPRVLAAELGPSVRARHLQLWSRHPDEQALFERIGADGSVERDGVDSFGVVTQNYNGNKIDWFLHRTVTYDADWDPADGSVSTALEVVLDNRAPPVGLPHSIIGWGGDASAGQIPVADGENLMWTTLYGTFPFTSVTVDGRPVDFVAGEELGHHTARFIASVPPESSIVVRAAASGTVATTDRYVVHMVRQPVVNPDDVTVRIRAGGWSTTGGTLTATSGAPIEVTLRADRPHGSRSLFDRLRGTP